MGECFDLDVMLDILVKVIEGEIFNVSIEFDFCLVDLNFKGVIVEMGNDV